MSLIAKNGTGGAGQKRIWCHGDLFRELFWFLWNLCFFSFKTLFDVTMSLISKNGSGGAGQKRIWSHGDLFRELFRFLWKFGQNVTRTCRCALSMPYENKKLRVPWLTIRVFLCSKVGVLATASKRKRKKGKKRKQHKTARVRTKRRYAIRDPLRLPENP